MIPFVKLFKSSIKFLLNFAFQIQILESKKFNSIRYLLETREFPLWLTIEQTDRPEDILVIQIFDSKTWFQKALKFAVDLQIL